MAEAAPEVAAEAPVEEAPIDMDAMMAAMAAEEAPVAEEASAAEAVMEDAVKAAEPLDIPDIDPVMAAMIAAGDMPAPEGMDLANAGVILIEEPTAEAEMPAEEIPVAEAEPEVAAEVPTEEASVDMDAMMAAMAAEAPAEEAPVAEMPIEEIPVAEAEPEIALEEPALEESAPEMIMNMAAEEAVVEIPEEAMALEEAPADPLSELMGEQVTEAPAEEIALEEPVAEEIALEEPVLEEAPVDELALEEPAIEDPSPDQIPSEFDMSVAASVMEGAIEDIEGFLNEEDYEYTTVTTASKTLVLIKTADDNSMALTYDNGEFESLDSGYDKEGKTAYGDITNVFVKETISGGGCTGIKRHKGSKVVAK